MLRRAYDPQRDRAPAAGKRLESRPNLQEVDGGASIRSPSRSELGLSDSDRP
ncbi:hypothetical protein [Caudoviricetes sp.]|nr:hypothetical protein [Caudoviricetes sp.]